MTTHHVISQGVTRKEAGILRKALSLGPVIADGAMGTMLQAADPTLEDFQNH